MSIPEGCSCSLQARLHQVENARSREMKAHGELVQTLERELECRRTSEAELRLAAAKFRTDNCRLGAELCAANAKARQLLEQLDNQRADNARRTDEFKAANEENERRLQAARGKGDQLLDEKRQLSVELSESQKLLECSRHDGKLLQAKMEEQCVQISSQTEEIAKLLALASTKQQEIDGSAARSQILREDLSSARQERSGMQEQLDELERSLTRAVVTRNRALQWRRKRQEIWDDRFISHGTFLAWKSLAVQSKLNSVINMAHCHERKRARLKLFQDEVLRRCSQAKEDVCTFRHACAREQAQIKSLRDEICQKELPKLVTLFEKLKKSFDSQRQELEAQITSQKECIRNEEERLDMSRQDIEHRVQKLLESHRAQLNRRKLQQRAIFQAFAARRCREFQRRIFSVWKEFHLRSLVGQVTHTAMIFQSQQSQASIVDLQSPSRHQRCTTPVIQLVSVALEPLQFETQKFDDCLRSPEFEAVTPIDVMWRKWRRIDAGVAGRGHKPRPSPNLPS